MTPKVNIHVPTAILAACIMAGCVPANQTIEYVNNQTYEANRELAAQRGRTRDLIQERDRLESKLASLRAKKGSLEASDPVSNRGEIEQLNREIAALERQLSKQL